MMQITHAATAAVAGSYIPNTYLAFLAGIILHLFIDKIPHFWPNTKKGKTILIIFDHSITYLAFGLAIYNQQLTTPVMSAIFGALLVDAVLVGSPYVFKSKLGLWHIKRQIHKTELIYLFLELLLALIFLLLFYWIHF